MINQLNKIIYDLLDEAMLAAEVSKGNDGSITATIARHPNGDIGITSENSEITVFGLGCHSHFSSSQLNLEEIMAQRDQFTGLLIGLTKGNVYCCGVYGENMKPLCGGFIESKGDEIEIDAIQENYKKIVLRRYMPQCPD